MLHAKTSTTPVFATLVHDRNRHHYHTQVIPIPREKAPDLLSYIETQALSEGFETHRDELPTDERSDRYFALVVPDVRADTAATDPIAMHTRYLTIPTGRYDMQFVRYVPHVPVT